MGTFGATATVSTQISRTYIASCTGKCIHSHSHLAMTSKNILPTVRLPVPVMCIQVIAPGIEGTEQAITRFREDAAAIFLDGSI